MIPHNKYLTAARIPEPEYLGGEVVITIASKPRWNGFRWIYEFVPVEAPVAEEQRSEAA